MSDDVLITPASRKVEFFDSGGNIDGKIELDASGNLNITSTGSIGIGDITQDIHIGDGTQAVDLVFDFTSSIYSVANQDLTIGKGSLGGNDITIDSASAVILSLAGTEKARLTSTGLGIGTTSPDTALEIMNGTLKITREETDDPAGSGVTEDDVSLSVAGGLKWTFSKSFDDPNPVPIGTTTDNDVRIIRNNQTHTYWYWDRTYFSKKVGIGTTTIDAPLHVQSASDLLSIFESTDANAGIRIDSPDDGYSVVFFAEGGTDKWSLGKLANNSDKFSIYDEVNNTPRLVIDTDGDIGIGTLTPDAKLDIEQTDGAVHGLKVYRNDSSTSTPLVYLHDDSIYVDNPTLHVKNDRTDQFGYAAIFEGSVGINNTAPTVPLDVNGDVFIGDSSETTALSGSADLTMQGDTALVTFKADNGSSGDIIAGIRVFADSFRSAGMIIGDYNNTTGATTEDWLIGRQYASATKVGISATPENGGDEYLTANSDGQKAVKIAGDNDDIDFIIHGSSGEYFRAEASTGRIGIGVSAPLSTLDIGASGVLTFGNIRTQLKITNSSADLQLGHADNAHILIDTFNNSTTNYFSVRKDSTTASSATELFRVQEDGKVKINDTYTLPTSAGNNDEILTYDTATSAVSYSNLSRLAMPTVLMDSGSHTITTSATTIPFDTATINVGSNATLGTLSNEGHIALTKGGYYRVSYSLPVDEGSNHPSQDRTMIYAYMETSDQPDFSSGVSTVTQSRAQTYTRENSGGSGLSTSFIFQHSGEEYIRIRVLSQQALFISTETNTAQISIEYLGS